MAQLFDIRRVVVGPKNLEAEVVVAPGAPLLTSEDPAGTDRVMGLIPALAGHVCLGDSSEHFGEVAGNTELAHLLEHVTVELLALTNIAGDVTSGQTVQTGERSFKITLACPDDVLVAGALSSAVWILQWAYSGGGEPEPDVEAIASGLVGLVGSLGDADASESAAGSEASGDAADEPSGVTGADEAEPAQPEQLPLTGAEPYASEPAPAYAQPVAAEPAAEYAQPAEPEPAAAPADSAAPANPWDTPGVPRPRPVR